MILFNGQMIKGHLSMLNRKLYRTGFILILSGQFIWSCAYENEEDLFGAISCDDEATTYSEVIQPILSQNCTVPSCHDGSNPSIPNWQELDNVQANASKIKEKTEDRTMPPSSSGKILSAEQIGDIACWVDSGARDN
ncbi:MAG: hypothetical protein DHS20C17_35280 [Cyclobacteriaceae bacterium]|nr:MAG: hypothetical protein DHS20C17_35280 [Cyclobacteriaceae bacterium]